MTTLSDRELLERAAKAAGIDLIWNPMVNALRAPIIRYVNAHEYDEWNPLTDDGDALRLAVSRRFTIKDFAPHDNPKIVQAPPDAALWGMVEIWREDDNDPLHVEWYKAGADRNAVTRRAITRAAATEIGKGEAAP